MGAPNPKGTRSFGNRRRLWVKSITDLEAMTVAEATALTSLDITLISYATSGRPGAEVTRGQSPRRLGGTTTLERRGQTNRTFGDLVYTYGPQKPDNDPANVAYSKLKDFEEGFIVEFLGIPGEDDDWAPTADDRYTVYPVELGPQVESETGDAEGDEFAITQAIFMAGEPIRGAVAA